MARDEFPGREEASEDGALNRSTTNCFKASSWAACKAKLKEISAQRSMIKARAGSRWVSELLYRGQSNAEWTLNTTLERQPGSMDYHALAQHLAIVRVKPHIETLTGKEWAVPDPTEFEDYLEKQRVFHRFDPRTYAYMAYLRHLGFPSPLLDWSRSPFIAAFFAFREAPEIPPDFCSLYGYLEAAGGGKGTASDKPHIRSMGPDVRTHRRHFLQQCEYTFCLIKERDVGYLNRPGIAGGHLV